MNKANGMPIALSTEDAKYCQDQQDSRAKQATKSTSRSVVDRATHGPRAVQGARGGYAACRVLAGLAGISVCGPPGLARAQSASVPAQVAQVEKIRTLALVFEPADLFRAQRSRLHRVVAKAVQPAQLAPLQSEELATALAHRLGVASCTQESACQQQLAKLTSADSVLSLRVDPTASTGSRFTVERLDVGSGLSAGPLEEACVSCGLEEEQTLIARLIERVIAEPASRGRGRLRLTSEPLAADIVIDGREIGPTPLSVELREGLHDIVVAKFGYAPHQVATKVIKDQIVAVHAALPMTQVSSFRSAAVPDPGRGAVQVSSEPQGARVQLDGRKVGETGSTPLWLLAGDGAHEVVLEKEGFIPYRGKIKLAMERILVLEVILTRRSTPVASDRRSPWRLITGAMVSGAGLVIAAFGGSALAVEGICSNTECSARYFTLPIGFALTGVAVTAVAAGTLVLSWPERKRVMSNVR